MRLHRLLVIGLAGLSIVQLLLNPSQSYGDDDSAAFYRSKTVRMIVGFPAGGGYDAY